MGIRERIQAVRAEAFALIALFALSRSHSFSSAQHVILLSSLPILLSFHHLLLRLHPYLSSGITHSFLSRPTLVPRLSCDPNTTNSSFQGKNVLTAPNLSNEGVFILNYDSSSIPHPSPDHLSPPHSFTSIFSSPIAPPSFLSFISFRPHFSPIKLNII